MKRCKHIHLFYDDQLEEWRCQDCGMTFELEEVRGEW